MAYQLLVLFFNAVFSIFFRAIQVRGSYKIPRDGPVIFVAAPHANQFVDPMMIIINCWLIASRKVSFLIAKVSYDRPIIGKLSRLSHAIPVGRVQDSLRTGAGEISISGTMVTGKGTKFTSQLKKDGYLVVEGERVHVKEVIDETRLVLATEFKSEPALKVLKLTAYKTAERVDHKKTFQSVFDHLSGGGCLGIFPEGGSHDRTDLLPMKNGVSIMALGTMAQFPDCKLKVVPVGLNYFHPHKFRSRAVVEFGSSITPSLEQVERYKQGGEEAHKVVNEFLDQIQDQLRSVTVACPDYETLQLVQACRRLYRPRGNKVFPLAQMTEFTRRMVKGYEIYRNNPKIEQLKAEIVRYNSRLHSLGIRDHQVPTTRISQTDLLWRFVTQTIQLMALLICVIPGLVVNAPAFVATRIISRAKARAALKSSSVKVRARDVIATWKVLVALWFIPTLYTSYSAYVALRWTEGSGWYKTWVFCLTYGILIMISTASLKIFDSGVDSFKMLVPLFMSLSPRYSEKLEAVRSQRENLVYKVTDIVNELGPTVLKETNNAPLPWSTLAGPQHYRRVSSTESLADLQASASGSNQGSAQLRTRTHDS